MKHKTKAPIEVLSPEGVEERLEHELTFRTTMTAGGKFRVYLFHDRKLDHDFGCFTTRKDAERQVSMNMIMFGNMMYDPKSTIDSLLKAMGKK